MPQLLFAIVMGRPGDTSLYMTKTSNLIVNSCSSSYSNGSKDTLADL